MHSSEASSGILSSYYRCQHPWCCSRRFKQCHNFAEPSDRCQGRPGLEYQSGGFDRWAYHDARSDRHSGRGFPLVEVDEDGKPIGFGRYIPTMFLFCHSCQPPGGRVPILMRAYPKLPDHKTAQANMALQSTSRHRSLYMGSSVTRPNG